MPSAEADKIVKRELAKVVFPADGNLLGDWKEGKKIANNGRGGQFSDNEKTVNGGNCYACHQMELKEVSYGTLGPSLTSYGKDRKFDPAEAKQAFTKIYNSQAVVACSNMPRFGANKFLTEKQIKDHRRVAVRSGVTGQQIAATGPMTRSGMRRRMKENVPWRFEACCWHRPSSR